MKRLYPLFLGEVCCDKEVLSPGVSDGRRIHIPICAFLISTDEGRLVLIDTGMHRGHIEDPSQTFGESELGASLLPQMRLEDSLDFRLAALGRRAADITDVVNTHLHFDHAGNNEAFTEARFWVQREQYEAALDNPSFPNRYWRLPQLRYQLLEGETDLGDGISVLPSPGHAPGHQSVLVELDSGEKLILCGDAIYEEDNLSHDAWEAHENPAQARQSARLLMQRGEQLGASLIYGHDQAQWARIRREHSWYQ